MGSHSNPGTMKGGASDMNCLRDRCTIRTVLRSPRLGLFSTFAHPRDRTYCAPKQWDHQERTQKSLLDKYRIPIEIQKSWQWSKGQLWLIAFVKDYMWSLTYSCSDVCLCGLGGSHCRPLLLWKQDPPSCIHKPVWDLADIETCAVTKFQFLIFSRVWVIGMFQQPCL